MCFSKQAIDFSRVVAISVLLIKSQLRLVQKVEGLSVTIILYACIRHQPQSICLKQKRASGPFLLQTFLNLGDAILKLALPGTCPSAQDQSHGQIVYKLMLLAEFDCRLRLARDDGSLATKLMHPEADRLRHRVAERMLRCICITARLSTNPERLIGIAEQPNRHAVVQPYVNARVLP